MDEKDSMRDSRMGKESPVLIEESFCNISN